MSRALSHRLLTFGLAAYSVFLTSAWLSRSASAAPESDRVLETSTVNEPLQYLRGSARSAAVDAAPALVVWTDYQCPYCRLFENAIDSLEAANAGRVRVLVRHFPLASIHSEARRYAELAVCSDEAGAFPAVHSVLFDLNRSRTVETDSAILARAGVHVSAPILECIASGGADAILLRDSIEARGLGIAGTPAFLVGKTLVHGTVSTQLLDSLLAGTTR